MVMKKQIVLAILTVMATIGLIGQIVPGLAVFADESDTDTEQKIKILIRKISRSKLKTEALYFLFR